MIQKRLVFGVGLVLVAGGLLWGRAGYYADDVVWLVGLLVAGGLVMWIATKMPTSGRGQATRNAGPGGPAPRQHGRVGGTIDEKIAATQFGTATTKSFEQIAELGRVAAQSAAGVATTVHEAQVSPGEHVIYQVKRLGVRTVLTFGVSVVASDRPGENLVALTVANYLTSQAKVLFIPIGPKSAAGYGPLKAFSESLQDLLADGPALPPTASAVAPSGPAAPPSAAAVAWLPAGETGETVQHSRRPLVVGVAAVAVVAAGATALVLALGRDGEDPAASSPDTSVDAVAPAAAAVPMSMRPVLEVDPTVTDGCAGSVGTTAPGTDAKPSPNGSICYLLGPEILRIDARSTVRPASNGVSDVVEVQLPSDAAATLADYTAAHIGESIAIVVDDVVISAPTVQGAITGGDLLINGDEQSLARLLDQMQGG